MKFGEIQAALEGKFPDWKFTQDPVNAECLIVPLEFVPEGFEFLRNDPALNMEYFDFSTCVDHPPERLEVVYSVYSPAHKHRIQLKVVLDRDNPALPTLSHIWHNADWNEREIYDLFGVFFRGHKDLRRLMMPEDWEGHPLRKDYAHPNVVKRPD